MQASNIRFFKTPAHFRKWLEQNQATAQELWAGFHKTGSGKPSMTWPESVDEALCFGWIDGIRKNVDETSYTIRFTRRKPGSIWSAINIKRAQELIALGRMQPPGLIAFQNRKEDKSRIYAYEQAGLCLGDEYEKRMQANPAAWKFFRAQAPWYQRTATWWVISAKQETTRLRRLDQLIADSAEHRIIGPLNRTKK